MQDKGVSMTFQKFCTHFFFWSFGAFMVVHYAWVKQPSQSREIASSKHADVKPWYDASWKQ
jgi:hypothetical protein